MDPLRCPRTGQPKVEGETSGFLLRYLSSSQTPVPQPTLLRLVIDSQVFHQRPLWSPRLLGITVPHPIPQLHTIDPEAKKILHFCK